MSKATDKLEQLIKLADATFTDMGITADVRASVRAMAEANPDMSHQEIGTAHNINQGRVSEILHGHRG